MNNKSFICYRIWDLDEDNWWYNSKYYKTIGPAKGMVTRMLKYKRNFIVISLKCTEI